MNVTRPVRRAAPFFALKNEQAETIIGQVGTALQDWKNIAHKLGMSAADIAVYATAIEGD